MRLAATKLSAISYSSGFGDSLYNAAGQVPSLDLNFTTTKSLTDAVTGASLVTFNRASSGTFVGSDGVVQTAVTNLVTSSESFNDANWTANGTFLTANSVASPSQLITADTLIETAVAGVLHYLYYTLGSITGDTVRTFSVFCKNKDRRYVRISHVTANSIDGVYCDVDLQTGTIVNQSAVGNGTFVAASITSLPNGWYRISITGKHSSVTSAGYTVITLRDSASNVTTEAAQTYTGDGTSGIYIWGAQLEQSATVGEYIPTTSTVNSAPRFDHNPITGESLGLLVEEQRTNLLLRSEDYSTTWFTSNVTRTGNTTDVTAPDGQITASKFVVATGGALGQGVISTAVSHTGSIYLRTGSGTTTLDLVLYRNSPFQLIQTASVTVTSTWQRFSVTGAFVDTTNHNFQVNFGSNKTVYAWGAQLEAGAFPTSYIPTTTAAATRSADVCSITGSAFTSFYNQSEGTIYHQGRTPTAANFFSIDDATINNRITSYMTSATAPFLFVATGGTAQANLTSSAIIAGSTFAQANVYKVADFGIATNGGTVSTTSTGLVPVVNRIIFGANVGGAAYINGTIRRFCFWPTRLANETLQSITQ